LVGVGLAGVIGLFLALLSQSFIGYALLGSMKSSMRHGSLLAVSCFGVGSLVLSVMVLIVSSLGDVPRSILRFGLDSGGTLSGLIAVAVLGRRRWKSAGVLQTPDRDFWGFVSLACLLLVAIDWRLIALVVSAAFAFLATPRNESQFLLPRCRRLLGPGFFVACVEAFRAVFMRRDVVLNARELALGSVDVEWWTSMAWSVLRYGPFEDVQKFGTMPGYHILAPTWAGATAALAHVDVVILVSLIGYLVFGGMCLVSALHIVQRYMAQTGQVGMLIAFLLATGSLSAIELKAPLSPESLTQFVGVSWLVGMVTLLSSASAATKSIGRGVFLGLLIGCTYLAKVSLILAALWIVIIFASCATSRKSTYFYVSTFAGLIVGGVTSHAIFIWPARNQAIFGDLAISTSFIERWLNFLSDSNFSVAMKSLSVVMAASFSILVMAALVSAMRARKFWSFSLLIGGMGFLGMATTLQFGTIGNGESYIWSYGTLFATVGLVASNLGDRALLSGRRTRVAAAMAGIGIGIASGLGFWVLRVFGNGLMASLATSLLAIVLLPAMVLQATSRFHSRASRVSLLRQFGPVNPSIPILVTLFLLGAMSGNYFGFALRAPVVQVLSALKSENSLTAAVRAPIAEKIENRPDFLVLAELRCLNLSTNSDVILAVDGIGGSSVLGVAQRALYYNEELLGYFPDGHPMKAELDRRFKLVSAATRTGSSAAVEALRAEGVSLILIGAAIDVPVEQRLWRKPGVCSSDDLFVWEL